MYFSVINLGCNKNLVDTQFLLGSILEKHSDEFFYVADPYEEGVELVFLNSCGFISSGRAEMFETVDELIKKGKKICLLGCATQYFEKLVKENNLHDYEIAHWERLKSHHQIIFLSRNDVANFSPEKLFHSSKNFSDFIWPGNTRAYTNISLGYEYLKIAEGCSNQCSFCIIPKIRGKQVSLPIENILQDAENLINLGVKEIILIAQDTSRYGLDLYGTSKLFELLKSLDSLKGDFNYRLLYLYPDILTKELLKKFVSLKKFIPYFDIPLQHISSNVLKHMGRYFDRTASLDLLKYIREKFKSSYIRTNFIIGFPGESEEDFQQLLDFIKEDYFDNIALFEYHDEVLAPSYKLSDKIDEKIIRNRFIKAEKITKSILKGKQRNRIGKEDIGFIVDYTENKKHKLTLTVRPLLHCPEIDEEDVIGNDQILQSFDGKNGIQIGNKVKYLV